MAKFEMSGEDKTKKRKARKESRILAVVDTREQRPLNLERHGLATIRDTLPFGDYSLLLPDLRDTVTFERKSIGDFVACCYKERARFEKEVLAMRSYKYKYVVCEFALCEIFQGEYRSLINPDSVASSIAKWSGYGVTFLFAESRDFASYLVAKMLIFIGNRVAGYAKTKTQNEDGGVHQDW